MSGSLLVVSGPSGSGKSTLCRKICEIYDFARLSISTTTRPPREGEREGEDYFFVEKGEFQSAIERGEFLEWANVHNNLYGTSKRHVLEAIAAQKTVIFDIDVQGQEAIVKLFKGVTTSVFITAPHKTILRDRLIKRGSDSPESIAKRLENAQKEMSCIGNYDYLLVNDDFQESLAALQAIALASRYKQDADIISGFISDWTKGE
ncbi:guanylate kinase [Campylobacterota bacterium]|nr:guanylate kinase [Campylobacterota bacterium]